MLAEVAEQKGVAEFAWRTQNNTMISPAAMTTQHLYYTLRMIWNHAVPEEYKLHPYKVYSFGGFYTKEYILSAIKELMKELCKRKDLKNAWVLELSYMICSSADSDELKMLDIT